MHGSVAVTARKAKTHVRASSATVDSGCLTSFFNALDARHQSRVTLGDLAAFTARHNISFEVREHPAEGQMPLPMSVQHARVLEEMFAEAATLREPKMYAKAPTNSLQAREPALELADVAAVLALRPALSQSARGSEVSVSARSVFRPQWLQLLLCVESSPFEPAQYDVHAGAGYMSQRVSNPHPLPCSMFEREAAHALSERTARAERRRNAPGDGPYNPTVALNAPPTARSSAESYSFTQPTTRRTPLSPRYLAARAARDAAALAQQEKEWNPRQRRLKQLARALDASARTFHLQDEQEDGEGDELDEEKNESREDYPVPARSAPAPVGQPPQSEALDAPRLGGVTFRTREAYLARVDAAQLKSEALDYRDDAQAHLVDPASADGGEDALAARLLASMVGTAAGGGAEEALKPQGTARERVARALAAQKISLATSGRFKLRAPSRPGSASAAAPVMHLPDGSVRPRWINANAPEGGSTRRSRSAAQQLQDPGVAAALAVQYDDQGRPILPAHRHALSARADSRPGMAEPTPLRRGADAAQAALLAERTAHFVAALPVTDPIDAALAPYVPVSPRPDALGALRRALDSTPSVAATSRSTHRDEVAEAGAAAAAAPSATQSLAAAAAVSSLLSARSTPTDGGSASSRRPAFLLDFHLLSPQDERRIASQTLSCFLSPSKAEKPTIANGGITKLEQLKPGYCAPPAGGRAAVHAVDRDASVGDLSLLPRGSSELAMVLARQKLDSARPAFRLDFRRSGPLDSKSESDVITRDGGATTAAESEAWRMHQLGFSGRGGAAMAVATKGAQTARQGKRSAAAAASSSGSQTSRHSSTFTTLGARPGPDPAPLHVSEREAVMRERGQGALLRAEKDAERRVAEAARLRPSERRRIELEQKQLQRFQQFPFTRLAVPEEAKAQLQ